MCLLGLNTRELYPTAQNFRIGIGGLAQKVFIEGTYGKERGINAVYNRGEGYKLVSAQIQLYGYVLTAQRLYTVFNGTYSHTRFNHMIYFSHF